MIGSRVGWPLFLEAIVLSSWLGMASAEDPMWSDAMKAAQKAIAGHARWRLLTAILKAELATVPSTVAWFQYA